MSLWRELRERNVFRVGTAYLAVAWLVMQVVATLTDPLDLPDRFATIVVVLLAIGFPVALVLAWAFELTPEGMRRTAPDATGESRITHTSGHRLNYVITLALALAVGFLLFDRFAPWPPDERSMDAEASADSAARLATGALAGRPLDERIRLAILPLRPLSNDPELGFFAIGLSEQLIRELKQIPELLVTDRGASFQFRDVNLSHREIAQALGVAYLLEGTIAGAGSQRRISVALTRVDDDAQMWETTRDFTEGEIFAVQDEITEQIATALSVRLGVLASRRPAMTRNVEAYTTYLTATGLAFTFVVEQQRAAIPLFQRAIGLDPNFMAARMGLYGLYRNMATLVPAEEAIELRERADETLAAVRALEPQSRMAALIDAGQSMRARNWGEADALLRRDRIEFPAADESVFNAIRGTFLVRVGRIREAITVLETARALAPQDASVSFALSVAYQANGDMDSALREAARARSLAGDSAVIAGLPLLAALAARDRERLEAEIAAANSRDPLWRVLGGLLDDREAAIAEIRRRLEDGVEESVLNVGLLAHWANYFDAPELALEITRSIPLDEALLELMIWDYGMRDVRRLPAFRDLVADLGLVDYWREYGWPDLCHPVGDDFECG